MDKITDRPKTPAENAAGAQAPPEISVNYKKRKAQELQAQSERLEEPAAVVAVTKREKDADGVPKASLVYSSKDLRARAAALLKTDGLSPEHKRVLKEILDKEGENAKAKDF